MGRRAQEASYSDAPTVLRAKSCSGLLTGGARSLLSVAEHSPLQARASNAQLIDPSSFTAQARCQLARQEERREPHRQLGPSGKALRGDNAYDLYQFVALATVSLALSSSPMDEEPLLDCGVFHRMILGQETDYAAIGFLLHRTLTSEPGRSNERPHVRRCAPSPPPPQSRLRKSAIFALPHPS
jgi:hypothetical protein